MLGVVSALVAALGWGTDAVLVRQGLRGLPAVLGVFLSLCAGLAVATVLLLIVDPGGPGRYPARALVWFAGVGLINFLIGRQCNFQATRRIGAARAASIFATSPLLSLVLAVTFTGERVNPPLLLGVALTVIGVVLVVRS